MIVDALRLSRTDRILMGFICLSRFLYGENVLPTTIAQDVVKMIAAHHLDVWIYRGKDWFCHEQHGSHIDREEWTVKFPPTVVSSLMTYLIMSSKLSSSDDLEAVARSVK